ncbi:MAG: tRNA (uridine(54)-C5)-methyltransferase TrmA [Cardiobacteriaceae bacterium]|nr:tRNA (uridine(54)-C5)-methyltransferase TrmA [Cardiobacteriaceae bacterium]
MPILMLLAEKITYLKDLLKPFSPPEPEIYESPIEGYRMRCEFRIWHEGDFAYYTMFDEQKRPQFINHFPIAHHHIQNLMQPLLKALCAEDILRHRLFQIDFHTTTLGDTLVTLIYHKVLCSEWEKHITTIAQSFKISVIGRSRKQKIVLEKDFVQEQFQISAQTFTYRQYENSFSQPNAFICEKMLNWAVQYAPNRHRDLLELYCGNGNFTLPLSRYYPRVLATEISKSGIKALDENIQANAIENIQVARLSAEEFTQAFYGERVFNRLQLANIHLSDYDFGTVLVDPPRAGIDDNTLQLLKNFDAIIYISCNPTTLAENLKALYPEYRITQVALFDQFPQTNHIECGVILEKY